MLPLLAGLAGLALVGNPFRAKRRNPGKARRGRGKAVTPSGAGARLAKWRWHHNPGAAAKVKHAAQLWLTGRFQTLEDAVEAAGLPMRTYVVERVQDEVDDTAERARRNPGGTREARYRLADGTVVSASGLRRMFMGKIPGPAQRRLLGISRLKSNPGRYARLDAKAVAKARLNIRSGGRPHTVWPAVKAQGASARARRTLTYGQRSRLSKRIAFEYLKAIKAGKRRRSH